MSLPMLGGAFLATVYNDQYSSGYAYRAWAAEWWKKLGHVPLWNPGDLRRHAVRRRHER